MGRCEQSDLSAHSAKAKQLKLELKGVDGSVVQQVDLVKSSTRRASRGGGNFHDATEAVPRFYNVKLIDRCACCSA